MKKIILLFCLISSFYAFAQCTLEKGYADFPFTIDGVTVTGTGTGGFTNYAYAYSYCGVNLKPNSVYIGQSASTYTNTFSAPVNDMIYNFAGANPGEIITVTVNSGTPTLTSFGGNCPQNTIITGNVVTFSGIAGGSIKVSSSSPYTSITFSHNGGVGGVLMTMCFDGVQEVISPPDLNPALTVDASALSNFTSCFGTSSDEQIISVTGTELIDDVLVTAPAGFEVSLTSGGTFSNSVTIPANGTLPLTNVYTRTINTAASGSFSGVITLASTDVTTQNVAVAATVNLVPQPLVVSNSLCEANSLEWVVFNTITSTTGTGILFGDVTATVTHSNGGMQTSAMFNHAAFPTAYNVPTNNVVRNDFAGTFTIAFSEPVTNPQVAFSSIGNPTYPVGIVTSVPYQVIWNGLGMTYSNSTSMTGAEGFTIVSFPGTHSSLTFDYLNDEVYVNMAFGAQNPACNNITLCEGESITLTASGGTTYAWSPATGLNTTSGNQVIATPTETTTYSVVDTSDPCAQPAEVVITVKPAPEAPVVLDTGRKLICNGDTLADLQATVQNDETLQWFDAATGGNVLSDTEVLVSGTTYYAESLASNGCSSVTRTPVYVSTNNSLYFDGVNDYVSLSGLSIQDGATAFTIEAWIKPDASNFDDTNYHAIFGNQAGSTSNTRNPSIYFKESKIYLDTYEDNTLNRFEYYPDTNQPIVFTENNWSHIALVKQGNQYIVYVNGAVWVTTPAPNNVNITGPYQFGFIDNYFAGQLDEVRFWDDARTQLEIQNNMNTSLTGQENGLLGYYTFDQGVANGVNTSVIQLLDATTNNNTGTFNNMSLTGNSSNFVEGYFPQITGGHELPVGGSLTLSHVYPNGTWSISDSNIASISASGEVTGLTVGTTTAIFTSCGNSASKLISVINPAPSITAVSNQESCPNSDIRVTVTVADFATPVDNLTLSGSSSNTAIVANANIVASSTGADRTITITPVTDAQGSATITLTVTNDFGVSETTTFDVSFTDSELPTVMTQDITVQLDANGEVTITPDLVNNGSTDNCGFDDMSLDITNFTCEDIGANQVILSITDFSGNVSTDTAIVTVEDALAPTVMTQDITVQLDANGEVTITPDLVNNGSTDNCGFDDMSLDITNFTCEDIGANQVILSITDFSGNVSTDTAIVTVEDALAPTVATQNITVQLDANGEAMIAASDIDNGSSDNCGIASMTLSSTNFDCSHLGANTVVLTVTDGSGNVSTMAAEVTVEDTTGATVVTQDITLQLDANGEAMIAASDIDNGSSDNCGIASMTLSSTNFDCSHLGANTVTLTVTDTSGNVSTGTATVTVEDAVLPTVFTQPLTIELDASGTASITADQVNNGSFDNCAVASVVVSQTTFDCSNLGTNTVTLTVTDVNGNENTDIAIITVQDSIDPVSAAQNITLALGANGQLVITPDQVDNGSSDNCDFSLLVSPNRFGTANVGDNAVILVATDASGNQDYSTAIVTIVDTTPPVAMTQDITLVLDSNGDVSMTPNQINNGSTDNTEIASVIASITDFDCTNLGVNMVTLTVTDIYGNPSTATANVTIIDTTAPTITVPADVVTTADANCEATTVALGTATTADNCGVATTTNNAPATFPLGDTVVTWTVTDASGNVTTATQLVTVIDASSPIVTAPADVTVSTNNSCDALNVTLGVPTVSDNCGIASVTNDAPATFPLGITVVTWTIADEAGNTTTVTQNVTVNDTVNPTIVAPANITVAANAACGAEIATLGNAITNDNCAVASVTNNAPSIFPLGETTVIWTVTDNAGNTATDMQFVTVLDETPPILTCIDDILVTSEDELCGAVVTFDPPTATDNCSGAGQTNTEIFYIPLSQISYNEDDAPYVNTGGPLCNDTLDFFACHYTGESIPVINFAWTSTNLETPSSVVVEFYQSYLLPNEYDLPLQEGDWFETGSMPSQGSRLPDFSNFPISFNGNADNLYEGPYNVCQNTIVTVPLNPNSYVSNGENAFSIAIEDHCLVLDQNPNTEWAAGSYARVIVTYSEIETEIEVLQTDTTGLTSGDVFPVGTTTLEYTATDPSGNQTICSFDVTVTDTTNPIVTAPADVTVSTNNSCDALNVTLGAPTTSDNCGIASVTNDAPATFPLGITVVNWTIADEAGNTTTVTQNVTVNDTVNPTIVAPANITVAANAACGAEIATLGNAITNDNCAVASVTNNAPSIFPLGETTVIWTVTDNAGNTATAAQLVQVNDTTAPTITVPADIVTTADANCEATTVALGTATTADNCGVATTTNNAPATFPLGDTVVTWTVTDNSGNMTTATQLVSVNDTVNPIVTAPADVTVSTNNSCDALNVTLGAPTASDNCGIASVTNDAPATFPLGITVVTWTIADEAGNTTTVTQNVTVNDTVNPTIVAPANITVAANAACGAEIATLGNAITNDNCGIASVTNNAPSIFPLGETTVIWTVTDNAGNTATAAQLVQVNDTTAPTITVPADIVTTADANCEATTVALGTATTVDNCNVIGLVNDAPATFPLGDTVVTWTVTDASGNVTTATQLVTVIDASSPIVTAPADVTVSTNNSCDALNVTLGAPTVSDNCGIASVTNDAPATFPLGITVVTWTIADEAGNTTTVTQNVTVNDTVNPTIVAPANITVAANAACGAEIATLGNAITNDNCGIASVTNNAPSIFPLGETTVIWTVTDNAGNTATAAQLVQVNDTTAPTITVPADIVTTADANCEATTVALGTATTADNCNVIGLVNDAPATFPLGDTVVTWTVTDASGNVTTATQLVTVIDASSPIVTAPADVTVSTNYSCDALNVTLGAPTVSDNCGIASVTNDAPATFPLGITVVTWTIADEAGNTTTVTQNVTVTDLTAPQVITRDLTVMLDANGMASITPEMINNGSEDTCSISSLSLDISSFDCSDLGPNEVTLTVTDASGNSAENTAIVTVVDAISPTVAAENLTIFLNDQGFASITTADIDSGSFDNCVFTLSLSQTEFNCSHLGVNTILLTATDTSGNSSTAAAEVTVLDLTSPVINSQDITIELDAAGQASITVADIDTGSFDTCSNITTELDQYSFGCSDEGVNQVLYTVTDASGNTATVIVNVTVENNFIDSNADGVKDNCGADDDNDGVPDTEDNCPFANNPNQSDNDMDGIGDACDDDDDNDGVPDEDDNCPFTYNPGQEDRNNNGQGDVCDLNVINISEAITPNGDGINDYWMVFNIENYPNNKVSVYNRWGALVFHARSYRNTWDGYYKNNSKPLPGGSYFYQIDLNGNGVVDYEGWIYLTR
ncbi:HYR domain-containing protein [Bizionia sediminis]|uniref:HYR domain-containing protein n=1 Tax=Bizionia sediminis TaxID=1737064 RepID=A0ABW5KUJ6_9FLAO